MQRPDTPWSLNRLFEGILNSLVDYFGGFSPRILPQVSSQNLSQTLPHSPEHPQNDPLEIPAKVAKQYIHRPRCKIYLGERTNTIKAKHTAKTKNS